MGYKKGIAPAPQSGGDSYQIANEHNNSVNGGNMDGNTIDPDAIWKKLLELEIDETTEVIPDDPILLIGGEVALSEHQISSIVGKPKAGKGQTLALFLNGLLNGERQDPFYSPLDSNLKHATILDTEQSKADAKRAINAVGYLGGVDGRIKVYPVRGLNVDEKRIALEELIKRKHDTCKLFVLDGIGEIAKNGVNDQEEGIELYTWLLDLVETYHVHIICFIHENKADNNATGFLGGYLIKKGEISFNIENNKKKGYHEIKPCYERHAPIDKQFFVVAKSETGIVYPSVIDQPTEETKITDARQIDNKDHLTAIEDIFRLTESYNKTLLEEKITFFMLIGRNLARSVIQWWVQKGWVIEFKKGNSYTYTKVPQKGGFE